MHSTSDLLIQTHALTRRFGNETAVDSLDLHVPAGSVYGFLGPNGAGKTTTIRMLLGLIQPSAGEVRLFGRKLHENRLELLERTGALVEAANLYPHLTGRENLEVTSRLRGLPKDSVERALTLTGLSERGQQAGARVFTGHAPAPGAGPGVDAQSDPAYPGRADQRPGPGRYPRNPRADHLAA